MLDDEGPLKISTRLYLDDVNSFDAIGMKFMVEYYLRQDWLVSPEFCRNYTDYFLRIGFNLTVNEGNHWV